MNAESCERSAAQELLRRVGSGPDSGFGLGEAALALASIDRPGVGLDHYRGHLADLAAAVDRAFAADTADTPAALIESLSRVIHGDFGYTGDRLTYDDLQNANLMRVIDRRKGLPIALGILYIHAARAQGWTMVGLAFPGHFLVRLEHGAERAILDPFNEGRVCGADDLRDLVKVLHGETAELTPDHYAPVSDREILLRLQNNIKLRLVQMNQHDRAAAVAETMLLFAPKVGTLWRNAGVLHAQAGNLRAAATALETYLERETRDGPRHEAAMLLQRLQWRLH